MFLLLVFFFFQAGPSQPAGVVTGLVRSADLKPAVNVRVFAIALRDAAEAGTGPTVFESLAQTDESGHYRLEVPPGRYLIACGSVESPTYFPATIDAKAAQPVTVASGGQVSSIDILGFIPPRPGDPFRRGSVAFSSLLPFVPPTVSTTISGAIRLQDGAPAKGMEVLLIPAPARANMEVSSRMISTTSVQRSRSDELGQYRFTNVVSREYFILTGTKDVQTFYPGVADLAKAARVAVTSPQPVADRNFVVPGVSLSGRATTSGGVPAFGTRVSIRLLSLRTDEAGPGSFMPKVLVWESAVDRVDGAYSVGGLPPGSYIVEADVGDLPSQKLSVGVADQALKGINFALPVATVSGNILYEDGTPLRDARGFGNIVLTTVDDSETTILHVYSTGVFGDVMEPGEYKISFSSMPGGLVVKSAKAGVKDLLKETLKLTDATSVSVEIRVER